MKLRHFSIRDLLWLFVVVALATGWGLDRFKLEQARRNEAAERQKAMVAARQAQYAAAVAAAVSENFRDGAKREAPLRDNLESLSTP